MSVSMRLSRGGSKKRPYYKIVVANSRAPRDGQFLEQVGTYNPLLAKDDENRVRLIADRVAYWLTVGAQPTERAATNNPNKAVPGKKAKERAEDKATKAAEAIEAAEAAKVAAAEAIEAAKAAAAEAAAAPVEAAVEAAPEAAGE